MSDEPKPANPAPSQPQPAGAPGPMREFPVDSSRMSTHYSNFARVTGTPEELVLDFGLNTQMTPNAAEPVRLTHRLVLNYYTAKRLLGALHMAIQQYENVYGVLETDVQKRVRSGSRTGPRPGPGMANA
jgi:hypothetical protein